MRKRDETGFRDKETENPSANGKVLQDRQREIAEIFHREYGNFLRYLRHKVADMHQMDLEDIIADLMLNLFNKTDITAGIENMTAYIYRSLHNRLIDRLRRNRYTVSLDQTREGENGYSLAEILAAGDTDVAAQASGRELQERVRQALERLNPKQRAVWVATELEGYTFRELSRLWDEPLGTLLARKHRAGEALKEALQDIKPSAEGGLS